MIERTTPPILAEACLAGFGQGGYFNWDVFTDQKKLQRDPYFDEIHKYSALESSLVTFQRKLKVPVTVQVVNKPGICRKTCENNTSQWVISADRWLASLP